MTTKRLAILSTHPIQYHSAWFRSLSSQPNLSVEVLYCHNATAREQANAGFGVEFEWDVSLLEGYQHRFLRNVAAQPGIGNFSGLDTPEVREIIAREDFDAVLINGWHYKSAWQAMRACWKTETPVMVRSDSHLHTERSGIKRAGKWPFYRWFISKLDACLPVGTWSSEYFLHYGALPERVITVPHAIDTEYFSREAERLSSERTAIRRGCGLDEDSIVFLFAGKFIDKKRPLDFVNAIGEARARVRGIAGLMVGDGPLREECEDLVRRENLPIRFTGFLNQSEIARAYVAADALVLPSDGGETWGLVVNEAMACGLPCFVSDRVGCGPDMIKNGVTGATFPLGDINLLGQLMSESANRKESLSSMPDEAKKQAAKYTAAIAAERTGEALEMVTT